jgi:hypothetical protein
MARPFGERHEAPPRVHSVAVSNGAWASRLLENGYTIPDDSAPHAPGRPPQFDPLPWLNVDRVVVRFTRGVEVAREDLRVTGAAVASYAFSDFSYDPMTQTAVWTLDRRVGADRLELRLGAGPGRVRGSDNGLALDGEWSNGQGTFPSGDGAPGGDFLFDVNVLPGDANQDGRVNAVDLGIMKQKLNKSVSNPGTGAAAYSPFADVNADGIINALDLAGVKQNLNMRLPPSPSAVPSLLVWPESATSFLDEAGSALP